MPRGLGFTLELPAVLDAVARREIRLSLDVILNVVDHAAQIAARNVRGDNDLALDVLPRHEVRATIFANLGILVILSTAFRSWRDALVIMSNLPLALIGGVVGVFLGGGVLSVASLIGFITLFGIATRNGIMLISHIKHLMAEEGVTDFRRAVIQGSCERLAPILMTALSTGLALIPIGLGLGKTGSEIHAPLALVVLCGLFSSTALNMIVVPAVYWRFAK